MADGRCCKLMSTVKEYVRKNEIIMVFCAILILGCQLGSFCRQMYFKNRLVTRPII